MAKQDNGETKRKDNLIINKTDLVWVKNNIQNSFSGMFLTLLSIIQGVALSFWVISISSFWQDWQDWPRFFFWDGVEKIAIGLITLLLVIITWHSYFWLAAIATWTPKFCDSLYIFVIGAMEFAIVNNMGSSVWYYAVGFLGILGGFQYKYNVSRLPDELWASDAQKLGEHIRKYKTGNGCVLIIFGVLVLGLSVLLHFYSPRHLWFVAVLIFVAQVIVMRKHGSNQEVTYDKIMQSESNGYTVSISKDEKDCWFSDVVELPGCHTQAKNMDDLLERTKEAIQAYLESLKPPGSSKRVVKIQKIEASFCRDC